MKARSCSPVLVIAVLLLFTLSASAGESVVTDEATGAALARFEKEFKAEDPQARIRAVAALSGTVHEEVVDRLLEIARLLKEESLARQKLHFEFPINPKTNEPLLEGPGVPEPFRMKRERDAMREAAVRCLVLLGYRRIDYRHLEAFTHTGHDGLVVAVLDACTRWEQWRVLPILLKLHRLYPDERMWKMGQLKTRKRWMVKSNYMKLYGDPDLQTARPEVVRAILRTVKSLTGEEVKSPDELAALLREPKVKSRVKRSR